MSIFAGNLASKVSLSLQSRVSVIPWVKRNNAILCLKGREFNSSSVPVRYTPKRSSKSDEIENSLPMKGDKKRVFGKTLDGVSGNFGLNDKAKSRMGSEKRVTAFSQLGEKINHESEPRSHELMGEPEEDVEESVMQQEKDISNQSMIVHKIMQDAEKVAVGLLARRAYTAVELRKKLHGKRFPPDIVEAVIGDFESRGLVNDGLYAETYSRSRWSSSSWGPRRIKKALSNKGASEADTDKALKLVFEDGDSDEQESKVGMSKISMDQLLIQASKQWLRGQDVPKDTRKSRLIRWLQYRGFNWDVVNFVLKKLESQHIS
ncbi:hypothetical protein Peur_037177 [Populus x canadensis]